MLFHLLFISFTAKQLILIKVSFNVFEQRMNEQVSLSRYVLIDTPGQIEVFTWSASGTIITEALVGLLVCFYV